MRAALVNERRRITQNTRFRIKWVSSGVRLFQPSDLNRSIVNKRSTPSFRTFISSSVRTQQSHITQFSLTNITKGMCTKYHGSGTAQPMVPKMNTPRWMNHTSPPAIRLMNLCGRMIAIDSCPLAVSQHHALVRLQW